MEGATKSRAIHTIEAKVTTDTGPSIPPRAERIEKTETATNASAAPSLAAKGQPGKYASAPLAQMPATAAANRRDQIAVRFTPANPARPARTRKPIPAQADVCGPIREGERRGKP
ncbi:hypothetical protein ASA1KI_12490 [Opitutales bacterium ASA1]|nr:hypothetical protein ASA1KI_12490 [Opitutales bacterium ASA1]